MGKPGMFGRVRDRSDAKPGGGCLPTRPHYPASVARALHALAESRPTPETYARKKARILGGHE